MSLKGRQGIDEAWARLSAAEMAAGGFAFAIGYVSEDYRKDIREAEINAYHAAGIAVLLVYEYSVTAAEGGAAKGTRDAGIAVDQARALGYPAGCAIAYAIDEDETPHPSNVRDYASAFHFRVRAAGYRSMVYGGLATVQYVLDNRFADLAWQTYAWSTRNGNVVWDPRAAIRQYRNGVFINGKDVDLDVAMVDDIGAWENDVGSLTGTQAGMLFNADAWAYAAANLFTRVTIAPGDDPEVRQEVDVPLGVRFLALEEAVKALQETVAGLTAGSLTDRDRAALAEVRDAVNGLAHQLASP